MVKLIILLLAVSSHAAPLVGTGDLQPSIYVSSAVSIGTTTIPTSSLTVYGVIGSSTPIPSISCTSGAPTMTAGSGTEFGSYAAGALATGCTVTFAKAFPSARVFCQCQASANLLVYASAFSATSVTCTSATAMTGDTITYICRGQP